MFKIYVLFISHYVLYMYMMTTYTMDIRLSTSVLMGNPDLDLCVFQAAGAMPRFVRDFISTDDSVLCREWHG